MHQNPSHKEGFFVERDMLDRNTGEKLHGEQRLAARKQQEIAHVELIQYCELAKYYYLSCLEELNTDRSSIVRQFPDTRRAEDWRMIVFVQTVCLLSSEFKELCEPEIFEILSLLGEPSSSTISPSAVMQEGIYVSKA
jgi:hypothetical protein